jgi:hypothetical protein
LYDIAELDAVKLLRAATGVVSTILEVGNQRRTELLRESPLKSMKAITLRDLKFNCRIGKVLQGIKGRIIVELISMT